MQLSYGRGIWMQDFRYVIQTITRQIAFKLYNTIVTIVSHRCSNKISTRFIRNTHTHAYKFSMVKAYKYLEQVNRCINKQKESSNLEYSGENPKDYEINRSSDPVAFFSRVTHFTDSFMNFLTGPISWKQQNDLVE